MHNSVNRNGIKYEESNKRYYYSDGYRMRAACVCVRNDSEDEVLLVSSSHNKNSWVMPGGGIELDEEADKAAQREAYEEAGVVGVVGRLIGVFENVERKTRTHVFVFTVNNELDEWEEHKLLGRTRKWFQINEAYNELLQNKPLQSEYLKTLNGFQSV